MRDGFGVKGSVSKGTVKVEGVHMHTCAHCEGSTCTHVHTVKGPHAHMCTLCVLLNL